MQLKEEVVGIVLLIEEAKMKIFHNNRRYMS
jgi:hypothetical protein